MSEREREKRHKENIETIFSNTPCKNFPSIVCFICSHLKLHVLQFLALKYETGYAFFTN